MKKAERLYDIEWAKGLAIILVVFVVFQLCGLGRATEGNPNPAGAEGVRSIGKNFIPLDFGPGFGSTWFSSRSIGTGIFRVQDASYEAFEVLRIEFLGSKNQQWIDHIPIWLDSGDYVLAFEARCDAPSRGYKAKLISMKCDKKGRFSDVILKRLDTGKNGKGKCLLDFKGVSQGLYILRFEYSNFPKGSRMDVYNVQMVPSGRTFKKRRVQIAPDLNDVLYRKGEPVRLGARVYLTQFETIKLKYQVTGSSGGVLQEGILGTFKEPGFFLPQTTFVPKDFDLYVVTYSLDGRPGLVTQKAFSVLPEGDCDFMGLHAYPKNRGDKYLVLGRRLGFKHYRDHDMGNFTRWKKVQDGSRSEYSPENPPPFVWFGDGDVDYLVNVLGYEYLGVLYHTPDWGKDEKRSIPGHSKAAPIISAWRKYVRNAVKHYTIDLGLIHNWEIWNEGKGISGRKLNDPALYIELLSGAIEEIGRLRKEEPDFPIRVVAFAGFNHKGYWREVMRNVKGFDVVSSHSRASRYRDTYYPARRSGRETRKKYSREGWLKTGQQILKEQGAGQEHWDSECGISNQVYPVYEFYDARNDGNRSRMPVADRSADRRYSPENPQNWGPVYPMEAAEIMTKQIVAHKASGVRRCYMYYFSGRDFVSPWYAEQMLEYDGSLMPYTHAYVFCSKMLENAEYVGREYLNSGDLVRERFLKNSGETIIDVIWNESDSLLQFRIEADCEVYSIMGRAKEKNKGELIHVDFKPVYVVRSATSRLADSIGSTTGLLIKKLSREVN